MVKEWSELPKTPHTSLYSSTWKTEAVVTSRGGLASHSTELIKKSKLLKFIGESKQVTEYFWQYKWIYYVETHHFVIKASLGPDCGHGTCHFDECMTAKLISEHLTLTSTIYFRYFPYWNEYFFSPTASYLTGCQSKNKITHMGVSLCSNLKMQLD